MRLAITGYHLASSFNEYLCVEDVIAYPLRNSANYPDGKFLRHLPQTRQGAFSPFGGMFLNSRHGIPGIHHFWKYDEVRPCFLRSGGELPDLSNVGVKFSWRARDLSSSHFHNLR